MKYGVHRQPVPCKQRPPGCIRCHIHALCQHDGYALLLSTTTRFRTEGLLVRREEPRTTPLLLLALLLLFDPSELTAEKLLLLLLFADRRNHQ